MIQASVLNSLYPLFAPLPVPFIEHLFHEYQERQHCSGSACLANFYDEVRIVRDEIYVYTTPYVLTGKLAEKKYSSLWLRNLLATQTQEAIQARSPLKAERKRGPISSQSLSDYREKHALRYSKYNTPEYDSAAALAIAFTLYKKERHRVPDTMTSDEPYYWVWMKRRREGDWERCPFPLPSDLPATVPIVSHWAGTAWQSPWVLIGKGIGAARFVGTNNQGNWAVTLDDLAYWHPQLVVSLRNEFNQADEDKGLIQDIANIVLRALAMPLLSKPFSSSLLERNELCKKTPILSTQKVVEKRLD